MHSFALFRQRMLVSLFALLFAFPFAVSAQQITISAAASLSNAFKELGAKFEAARPGTTVRLNFAASGVLLQQISQGAPVDIFASADQETMDRAAAQKLIDTSTRKNFAANSLVLVEPAQGGVGIKSLPDLAGGSVKKIAVGKTATVPAGRYTKQALETAGLWTTLAPKFVQADSVRQVLDYVARGEVEAGFVYRTDASVMGDRVKIVLSPPGAAPVSYPMAVTADSRQAALAKDFVAFVAGDAGQQTLGSFGFAKP